MKKSFQISIENPCRENWDAMTVSGNGKFCSSCSKIVVDFNAMSDKQIVDFLMKRKGSVCGRISKARAQTQFYYPQKNTFRFNTPLLRFSLAGILTFASAESFSQTKNTQKENVIRDNSGKESKEKQAEAKPTYKLMLRVVNNENKEVRDYQVTVEIGEWRQEFKGHIKELLIPDSLREKELSLSVSAPDYAANYQIINLKSHSPRILVTMKKEEEMMMGIIAIPD